MLGRNEFKVESNVDLSSDRLKSLVLFYSPLIGAEALNLYEFLVVKGSSVSFEEISKLLNSLLISIEKLELLMSKLNEYKLVQTLKSNIDDKYIFVLNNPLKTTEFIKNDILVRDFILKTSGEYYQSLLINVREYGSHADYKDVSARLNPHILDAWSQKDESFLTKKDMSTNYEFNTFFNVNEFLKDISTNLLPLRFRTEDNLRELAILADLYNISYEKMRTYLPKIAKSDSNNFDLNLLRYLCQNSQPEYKMIGLDEYDVPCELFLMNRQGGKEVTPFDKKVIYSLAHDYYLKPSVINVLLEYGLERCNGSLIEKFLYAFASDLNRKNIETANDALETLKDLRRATNNVRINKTEPVPTYETNNTQQYDQSRFDEILRNRGK